MASEDGVDERFKMGVVWFVSEIYYPDKSATGYIITRLAEGLANCRFVKVLATSHGGAEGNPTASFEVRNGVRVHRVKVPRLNRNWVGTRAIQAVFSSTALAWQLARRARAGDVVIAVTNPPPVILTVALVCAIRRLKCVVLIHDVFPENMVAAGIAKNTSLAVRSMKILMNWAYAAATAKIVISRDMGRKLDKTFGTPASRTRFIPNWAEADAITPSPRHNSQLLRQLGIEDEFVVQFAGNLGRVQGIDTLLEAARLLVGKGVHILFIGDGAKRHLIEDAVRLGQPPNITLVGAIPRQAQSQFLGACDVALVSLAPSMYGLAAPSKIYGILAAGRPVIAVADPRSDVATMVRSEGIGWVTPPGDADALAEAILEAQSSGATLEEMGERARCLAENEYSFAPVLNAYLHLIDELMVGSNGPPGEYEK